MRSNHDIVSSVDISVWCGMMLVVVFLVWITVLLGGSGGSVDESEPLRTRRESPLDAIAYDVPTFTKTNGSSYRVTDRLSHQSWWIIRIGGNWIVLPIAGTEVSMG